jgi:hypothetical protein
MPSIFHRVQGRWCAERFTTKHAILSFAPMRVVPLEAELSCLTDDAIELIRLGAGRNWIAIVREDSEITHNGQPVTVGLCVLSHGDVISGAHGASVFFSTEEGACVEPFSGVQSVSCPRCRSEIAPGHPVVRCPECGVFHHEIADRNCWTYAETCALCPQPTALDVGLRWSPDVL